MKFSVVVPTYNREKDLKECLDSVFRQTVLPNELLIIDDGESSAEFISSIKKKSENSDIRFV